MGKTQKKEKQKRHEREEKSKIERNGRKLNRKADDGQTKEKQNRTIFKA